ncbi:phytoene/squalene synthase family protein, partial [Rhizobium sp. BR5]
MEPTENLDVCLAMLRDTDRDRYLACLLSPADKRAALAALYAFNAEIARIRDSVREALPGEVRMQWWRDLIDGNPHGDSQSHPVAAALLTTIEQYRLPRPVLANMIEARIFDLYDDLFEDRNALEGYAGETASALIQLASLVLS